MTGFITVVVAVTTKGYTNTGDDAVGVEPSIVYRMVAPVVAVVIATSGGDICAPPAGVITGVATVPPLIQ